MGYALLDAVRQFDDEIARGSVLILIDAGPDSMIAMLDAMHRAGAVHLDHESPLGGK